MSSANDLGDQFSPTQSTLGVVLVAAGRGERLGAGKPKAFVDLGGRTLLEHCVATIAALEEPGALVVVVPIDEVAGASLAVTAAAPAHSQWAVSVVAGGRERHESVRHGFEALPATVEVALVHDAARPLTPGPLFERVADAVRTRGISIIPVLPVADTLKRVGADGMVHETVDRAPLVAVQTPQGFPRALLASAHDALHALTADAQAPTDDAEVVQRSGGAVGTVSGDTLAHKLTTPGDHALLSALLAAQDGDTQ